VPCNPTEWQQGVQLLWQQNKSKSSPSTTILDSWYEVFVLICYEFSCQQILYCAFSPNIYIWSYLSKGHCSIILVLFSDAITENQIVLPLQAIQLFLIVILWNFPFNLLTEIHWDVTLWFLQFLTVLQGLTLEWTCWDVHTWEDWQLS